MNAAVKKIRDYAQLMKLRLTSLVVFSAVVGFRIASGSLVDWKLLVHLVLGIFLIVSGANAANEIVEKIPDGRMRRTRGRPLPAGRMRVEEAVWSTLLMTVLGFAVLAMTTDRLTFLLGLFAYSLYVFVYTPLKRVSPWCVLVGAFPGAIPAMMGPVAVVHAFTPLAFLLFAIVFLWQFPHFCAIAWVAKEDYESAGFKVLASPHDARFTAYEILIFSCALLGVSPLMTFVRHAGSFYFVGSVALSLALCACALLFWFKPTQVLARRMMGMALMYLPSLYALMMLDRVSS